MLSSTSSAHRMSPIVRVVFLRTTRTESSRPGLDESLSLQGSLSSISPLQKLNENPKRPTYQTDKQVTSFIHGRCLDLQGRLPIICLAGALEETSVYTHHTAVVPIFPRPPLVINTRTTTRVWRRFAKRKPSTERGPQKSSRIWCGNATAFG